MTETLSEEREQDDREWRERIASTLELIAQRLGGPEHALVTKAAHQDDLLKEFVGLMDNPHSTDREWKDLLEDVRVALGMEASV